MRPRDPEMCKATLSATVNSLESPPLDFSPSFFWSPVGQVGFTRRFWCRFSWVGGIWWVYEFHHFSWFIIIEIKERKHVLEVASKWNLRWVSICAGKKCSRAATWTDSIANGYWSEATFGLGHLLHKIGLKSIFRWLLCKLFWVVGITVGIPSFVQPTSGRVLVLRPETSRNSFMPIGYMKADCIHVVGTIHRPQFGHKIVVLLNLRHFLMPPLHFKKRAVALPLCCIHTLGIFWQICSVATILSASQGLWHPFPGGGRRFRYACSPTYLPNPSIRATGCPWSSSRRQLLFWPTPVLSSSAPCDPWKQSGCLTFTWFCW